MKIIENLDELYDTDEAYKSCLSYLSRYSISHKEISKEEIKAIIDLLVQYHTSLEDNLCRLDESIGANNLWRTRYYKFTKTE